MPDDGDNWEQTESSFVEKLVEHVIVAELLQEAWFGHRASLEVARAEVDRGGYDVILSMGSVTRHVQLRASKLGAKRGEHTIHTRLAEKPSGCVVWAFYEIIDDRIRLTYRFFGGSPGEPLPELGDRRGKRTGSGKDARKPRENTRVVGRGRFEEPTDAKGLLEHLFALPAK